MIAEMLMALLKPLKDFTDFTEFYRRAEYCAKTIDIYAISAIIEHSVW